MRPPVRPVALTASALLLALTGCGDDGSTASSTAAAPTTAAEESSLTVYSGRNETLVADLFTQFTEATGTEVEVRYADSAELAATLLEEGDASPADVFFSQDAGALGALSQAGALTELPEDVVGAVDEGFRAADGTWVGVSGRARVLAYDPAQVPEEQVPGSVLELTEPQWRDKIAFAPTNASFQAFVTAMRVLEGEDATRAWLEGVRDNGITAYENNNAVLDAVDAGEEALGLINHYYWYERVAELGEDAVSARISFLDQDDPGALVNVAGAGVLASSEEPEAAGELVAYLLSPEGQQYFAERTQEYPLVAGTGAGSELPPLEEVSGPDIDLSELESLQETLALLDEVGLT